MIQCEQLENKKTYNKIAYWPQSCTAYHWVRPPKLPSHAVCFRPNAFLDHLSSKRVAGKAQGVPAASKPLELLPFRSVSGTGGTVWPVNLSSITLGNGQ